MESAISGACRRGWRVAAVAVEEMASAGAETVGQGESPTSHHSTLTPFSALTLTSQSQLESSQQGCTGGTVCSRQHLRHRTGRRSGGWIREWEAINGE